MSILTSIAILIIHMTISLFVASTSPLAVNVSLQPVKVDISQGILTAGSERRPVRRREEEGEAH